MIILLIEVVIVGGYLPFLAAAINICGEGRSGNSSSQDHSGGHWCCVVSSSDVRGRHSLRSGGWYGW